ncbi:MAG: SDR family NAD(P)-dependent oxidoreductase [Alphaproteobacteria bacterium]|nr:SDR family NAD(P)-dependent oxidoreductase [Alphaproteobacteria bacterium]
MSDSSNARIALITGASSGIGAAFARAYAARGCGLVLVARRMERLEALAKELKNAHGTKSLPVRADLAKPGAVQEIAGELARRRLFPDILVNNAGYSIARTFLGADWPAQQDFIEVCVTAPAALSRALLPAMVEKGWGRIINVSSIAAFSPGAKGHTLYPAAKAFLLKMSQSLAAEVSEKGVHVTALCPGQTESEFADANGTRGEIARARMPTQTPDEVVKAAIRANERGREIIVTGLRNRLAVAAMKVLPDGLSAALIRPRAAKFSLPD